MRVGYKLQDKFDFSLFIPVFFLSIIGLAAVYSSTINHPTASGNFEKQAVWFIISLVVFFIIYMLPSQLIRWSAVPAYLLALFFLVAVLFIGKTVYGAKSWMNLGPFGFQPSEFAKGGMILMLAYWLSGSGRDINSIKDLFIALLIGFIPVLLILMEPDMGTSIVFSLIILVMLYWAGLSLFGLFVVLSPGITIYASLFGFWFFIGSLVLVLVALYFFRKHIFMSAAVFVFNIAAGFFFEYVYNLLEPHQQKRIDTFLSPDADPLGHGYNAMQAKVAIGSGGLLGKGFMEGNQTQLRFIPEQWTDFIYCVIGEEFGFIGSIVVMALFLTLFIRLLNLSYEAKDDFSSLVVIGIFTLLFVHFGINIGMNIGLAPVIGLPLPFISYGGSSLLVNIILVAVAANIYRNRKEKT